MNTFLNPTPLDDIRLVERHLAGDATAFRQIVERHQGMVCALAYSACGDVARSEDLAQEVFVAAWKQLAQLREPAKLRGWLAGIARNTIANSRRTAARTPTARAEPLSPETPAEATSPREEAIRADEAELMWSALEHLPEAYREPMVLFYREGRSAAAVAETLEISEETARQRLARGRAMLTERMAKLVEETLERSAPAPAFAGLVMLSLPVLAPTVAETTFGAGGGAAAKILATAGTAGSAAAKGGVVLKFLSAVAVLPAVLQGAGDFIQFNERNANVADRVARRGAAKAYLWGNVGIGSFVGGAMLLVNLRHPSIPVVVLLGLWLVGATLLTVRAKCRAERLMAGVPKPGAGAARGFEVRSEATLLGLPLYHIRIRTRPTRHAPVVRGWIAISDRRAMGGLFAFGPFAVAPVSMGIVGVGLVSVSVAAAGAAALGIATAGLWAQGMLSCGVLASKGIVAVAPWAAVLQAKLAAGGGPAAQAFFAAPWFYHFTKASAWVLVWAGVLGWVMPVILTGWQLWQTRKIK